MSKKKKKIKNTKKKKYKKYNKNIKNKNKKKIYNQKKTKKTNYNNKKINKPKITKEKIYTKEKQDIIKKDNNQKKEKNITENNKLSQKNKNYKQKIIILIISIIILILSNIFIIIKNIKLELIGKSEETIEVFNEYIDPGFTSTIFNKNINNLIKTSSNINTNIIGSYKTTYKLSILNIKKTRTINVVDTEKPTITLKGNSTINLYIGDTYTDEGVEITDNYDSDLSNNLNIENNLDTSKKGTYTITYTVRDSSNNTNSITRTINVLEKIIINQNTTNQCNLSNPIEKYICQNNYNISVGYYNLTNGKSYYYKPNKLYYGASLIKTLDALYLYDKNLINDNLKEYVKLAITISDNPSHHYLVNYIGKNNLRNYGKSIGAKYTLTQDNENFGFTNVNDQIAYMKRLHEITKDGQNEELKSFFLNTRKNCLLFENSPQIMHKYGHWEPVYHNSGIVLDKNPYIVVILTQEGYNNYQTIIKTLSKLVYEYHYTN